MWWALSIFPAIIIFYQDLTYRAISWWTLPLLFFSMLPYGFVSFSYSELLKNAGINFFIVCFELLTVTIYFSIKHKKPVNIFKSYFGIGDALFFVMISPFFHPIYFVLNQIIGLTLILIGSLIYGVIKKDWDFKVPLAGFLALFIPISIIANYLFPSILCLKS
jgi:hypothetical protein